MTDQLTPSATSVLPTGVASSRTNNIERLQQRPLWLRRAFRKFVHFCSYHFILERRTSRRKRVLGFDLLVEPTVFDPEIFLTSKFFGSFLQNLDLTGKKVVDVGAGTGILALSAAKAGASHVWALDVNPAAARTTASNALHNGYGERVTALESDLFDAVPKDILFDVIISSPPSFAGEPRSISDRAWHAGPDYRDIASLFRQARMRLSAEGMIYLLLSSDSDLSRLGAWIEEAGLGAELIDTKSILVESFLLYCLRPSDRSDPSRATSRSFFACR